MLFKNLLILLIIMLLLVDLEAAPRKKPKSKKKKKPNCNMDELAKCSENLEKINSQNNASILTNDKGLDLLCSNSLSTANCYKKYVKNCGTQLHLELFNFASENFIKSIDSFCKPGKIRTEFLSQAECIYTNAFDRPEYHDQCTDPYLVSLRRLEKMDDMDDRLDTVCCSYLRWKGCLNSYLDQKCGDGGRKAIDSLIDNSFGGLSDLVCNNASFNPRSERCLSLYAEDGLKPDDSNEHPVVLVRLLTTFFGFLLTRFASGDPRDS